MVFSNGYAWATSTGDWNRQLSIADQDNWAYGSDKLTPEAGSTLKYFFNDELIYTSELTAADLYPYCSADNTPTNIDINDDYNTTKRIDFTVTTYPTVVSGTGLGLSSVNTVLNWDRFAAQFALDPVGVVNQQYKVMENNVSKTDYVIFTPSNGDVFSLRWIAPEGGGNITFPQIPPSKGIINSAFKS